MSNVMSTGPFDVAPSRSIDVFPIEYTRVAATFQKAPPECPEGISVDTENNRQLMNFGQLIIAAPINPELDDYWQAWITCKKEGCKEILTAVEVGAVAVTSAIKYFDIHWDLNH